METSEIELFFAPKDRLRMTLGDRSYPTIKPVWSSPVTRPGKYLSLLDGKGNEIAMVVDPAALNMSSREAVETELRRRYLTAQILEIVTARQEFGATYWRVRTDRGQRDFVCENLQENALWYSATHLMLLDTDGNRFEVSDIRQLDLKSRTVLESIL